MSESNGRAPQGALICQGTVLGRPIAWKAPTIARRGGVVSDPARRRYRQWQHHVATVAAECMGRREPYAGPVMLCLFFDIRCAPFPDLTNLVKAAEDALQGTVIRNDAAVCHIVAHRRVGLADALQFRVYAYEEAP